MEINKKKTVKEVIGVDGLKYPSKQEMLSLGELESERIKALNSEKYAFVYWIQAQDGVGQEVIGVIERDKIATHEAELIQLTKGMNGNSFER